MKLKTIILIVVIIAITLAIWYLEPQKQGVEDQVSSAQDATSDSPYPRAPELAGITGYINTPEGTKIEDFRGKVVLVDFWTYTCINCLRTLPYLTDWDAKYKDKGLVIIGVHTPEFEFEKKRENVEMAMQKYGINYGVVQDNDYATWSAFKNRYWPRKYLIDKDGYIRYDHAGEGKYEETEQKIQELLAEIGEKADMPLTPEKEQALQQITPELYAGFENALPRGQNIGNSGGLESGKIASYVLNQKLQRDKIHLQGKWESLPESLVSAANASLFLDFTAKQVHMVALPLDDAQTVEILLNGESIKQEMSGKDVYTENGKAFVLINESRLYTVVDGEYGHYVLEIKMPANVAVHAFTFG